MADIIQLADQLGKAIGTSAQATAMRDARQAVEAQPELRKALNEYQTQVNKIAQLEHDRKPVEPQDKQKLQTLHDRLVSDPAFKRLTEAQMEYVELLRKVNQAVRQQLHATEGQ